MLKYKGNWNAVNSKPADDEWIEVFASDYLKEHWMFYAFIRLSHYEEDVEAINKLINKLNWRDGDVYVELINHSDNEDIAEFYRKLYDAGYFTHWNVLNPINWRNRFPRFLGV